ncbi:DUF3127 domain-containing protein [Bacteroides sp. CR5/BHMF/2]|nr:DUF3127 domain-containing protein [Bacteroides sp. CR5/BHMF/2]
METKEQYPKKIAFSVMNDNIMNFGLTIGQEVDIHIDINATEWNGKWYNSITCWKVIVRNPGQQTASSQPNYAAEPPQHPAPHNRHNNKCSGMIIRMICLSKKVAGGYHCHPLLLDLYKFIVCYP